jgi:hypothetical protein
MGYRDRSLYEFMDDVDKDIGKLMSKVMSSDFNSLLPTPVRAGIHSALDSYRMMIRRHLMKWYGDAFTADCFKDVSEPLEIYKKAEADWFASHPWDAEGITKDEYFTRLNGEIAERNEYRKRQDIRFRAANGIADENSEE